MDKLWLANQILKKAEKRDVKPREPKNPIAPFFVRVRDNNTTGGDEFRFEDNPSKPVVEVGIGFTF